MTENSQVNSLFLHFIELLLSIVKSLALKLPYSHVATAMCKAKSSNSSGVSFMSFLQRIRKVITTSYEVNTLRNPSR